MFDNYLTTFISNNWEVLEKWLGDHVSKKEMKAWITLFSSIFVCLQSMSWRSVQVAKRIIKGSWIDQFRNIRLEHQVGEVGLIYSVVCQIDESFSIVDIVRLSNILDQRFKLNNVKELIECVYETPIEMPTINITYKSSYGVSKSDISYNNESKSKEMYSVISEYTLNKENVENKNKSFLNNENGALCNMNIFSIIFEIYSKLVQYVNGSFAKEIVTKLIYEDDNIAIISKEKSLSEIHKTVNFLSLVSTILSFENLSFIRQKFRRLFQIDLFFQKIDAWIELIQTEEQKDLEETYYLTSDLSKIFYLLPDLYYQLYFNLNYWEWESVQSLDNFFHIFLMNYKSRLESYIDNTNFKEEESIDTQMLKVIIKVVLNSSFFSSTLISISIVFMNLHAKNDAPN